MRIAQTKDTLRYLTFVFLSPPRSFSLTLSFSLFIPDFPVSCLPRPLLILLRLRLVFSSPSFPLEPVGGSLEPICVTTTSIHSLSLLIRIKKKGRKGWETIAMHNDHESWGLTTCNLCFIKLFLSYEWLSNDMFGLDTHTHVDAAKWKNDDRAAILFIVILLLLVYHTQPDDPFHFTLHALTLFPLFPAWKIKKVNDQKPKRVESFHILEHLSNISILSAVSHIFFLPLGGGALLTGSWRFINSKWEEEI